MRAAVPVFEWSVAWDLCGLGLSVATLFQCSCCFSLTSLAFTFLLQFFANWQRSILHVRFPLCAEPQFASETCTVLLSALTVAISKQGKAAIMSLAASTRLSCILSPQRLKFEGPAQVASRFSVLALFLDHAAAIVDAVSAAASQGANGFIVQSNLMKLISNAPAYFDKEWTPAKVTLSPVCRQRRAATCLCVTHHRSCCAE